MSKLKGPLILFVVAALFMTIAYFAKVYLFDNGQINTSDAYGNLDKLTIAGDGYLGYWFVNSPRMKMLAPKNGFQVDFKDDGGAYADRLKRFAKREYDAIVLPVNSYLEHGADYDYPGVIVAAVSESKGADALVGFPDVLPTGKVNDLNNDKLKIVYTSESPSSFLLDLTIADFDLEALQANNNWRSEVGSSEEVYDIAKAAKKDRSKGDAFVMWEPEVSRAIDKLGMKELWSSDKFSGYIIDVFVFHRDVVADEPEKIQKFLTAYFWTIDHYRNNRDDMIKEMGDETGLKDDVVENMVQRIDWYDKEENCYDLFGIRTDNNNFPVEEKMFASVVACSNVMSRIQGFDASGIDPFRLINSSFLQTMADAGLQSVSGGATEAKVFKALNAQDWADLKEVGTMRVEPITFQSGTNKPDASGEELIDMAAKLLINNYPNYRVKVLGHTGKGDAAANKELSQQRADAVRDYLIKVNDISPDRLLAAGVGAAQLPRRKTNESTRAYRFRMARVEFVLLDESTL